MNYDILIGAMSLYNLSLYHIESTYRESLKDIKSDILKIQDIYESSWDKEKGRYLLTMQDATERVFGRIDDKWDYFVYQFILTCNMYFWNDIQSWAECYFA